MLRIIITSYIQERREIWKANNDSRLKNEPRFGDDVPSPSFLHLFMKNHPFLSRSRPGRKKVPNPQLTEENLCRFFETLTWVAPGVSRRHIFNADETGIKANWVPTKVSDSMTFKLLLVLVIILVRFLS
jgi:hypothetical protein